MVKKIVSWGLLAFLVFYLVTRPAEAAGVVQSLVGGLKNVGVGLSNFVTGLA